MCEGAVCDRSTLCGRMHSPPRATSDHHPSGVGCLSACCTASPPTTGCYSYSEGGDTTRELVLSLWVRHAEEILCFASQTGFCIRLHRSWLTSALLLALAVVAQFSVALFQRLEAMSGPEDNAAA